ncbi:alcohol dehydrogenase-like [Styela clava]
MKRAVIRVPKGSFVVETSNNIPVPPENGAIVKTKFCGICHSDLHMWEKEIVPCPSVYGHEVSGELYALGDKAEIVNMNIGDNVMIYPWMGCGKCDECTEDKDNLCNIRTHEVGCGADGGYSNYVSVPDTKFLIKVPDSIPMDVACLLPCSGVTTYSAIRKLRPYIEKIKRKSSVLIVGAGGLGLWCLQWAKICLPDRVKIVCADINMDKLKVASEHGADDVICWSTQKEERLVSDEDITKELMEKTNGGFDGVIDVVNSSMTSKRAFSALKRNGTHVMVGLYEGSMSIPLRPMVLTMKRILGSYVGSIQELNELVKMIETRKVKPPPIIPYKLEEIETAWVALKSGKMPGRGVIRY